MPLTPQDVVDKQFTVTKLRNGYDRDEVDAFLDEVEGELARLLTENARLAMTSQAPAAAQAPAPQPAALSAGEPQEAALRTLLMAQRTADQAIAEAREEAAQAVATARDEAGTLMAQAQQRSAQVQQEVDARTSAALDQLRARQVELEARITDLRAFEREYRVRLKAYLQSQLRDLDARGGGGADDAGVGVPAAARTAAVGIMPTGVADSGAARPAAPPAPAPPAPALPAPPTSAPALAPPLLSSVPPRPESTAPHLAPHLAPQSAPTGPPREAPAAGGRSQQLAAVPEPVGPFTVVPPPVQLEQLDDGPEPSHP